MHAKLHDFIRQSASRLGWLLPVIALAVCLPLTGCQKKPVKRKVVTPKPATPIPATPTPIAVKPTPEPTPMPVVVATPTPAPTPPPLEFATVAQTPALWPAQVVLTAAHSFPVIINGRPVGEVKTPPGLVLKLLRVIGTQVEVEYQGGIQLVPAASTDLMPRALAISKNPALARPTPPPAPVFVPGTVVTPVPVADLSPEAIAQRVTVDVVRVKKSASELAEEKKAQKAAEKAGKATPQPTNYNRDDDTDEVRLRVRLVNTDSNRAATRLKGELFIFADSLADRSAIKLLSKHPVDCSIPPRGVHEITTPDVTTRYWTRGRYGFKYDSWLLRMTNTEGKEVLVKTNAPTLLRNASKLASLEENKTYERATFEPKDVAR